MSNQFPDLMFPKQFPFLLGEYIIIASKCWVATFHLSIPCHVSHLDPVSFNIDTVTKHNYHHIRPEKCSDSSINQWGCFIWRNRPIAGIEGIDSKHLKRPNTILHSSHAILKWFAVSLVVMMKIDISFDNFRFWYFLSDCLIMI